MKVRTTTGLHTIQRIQRMEKNQSVRYLSLAQCTPHVVHTFLPPFGSHPSRDHATAHFNAWSIPHSNANMQKLSSSPCASRSCIYCKFRIVSTVKGFLSLELNLGSFFLLWSVTFSSSPWLLELDPGNNEKVHSQLLLWHQSGTDHWSPNVGNVW
jgi:hypothetical protein